MSSIKEERQDEAEIRELAAKMIEANRSKAASTSNMSRQAAHLNIGGSGYGQKRSASDRRVFVTHALSDDKKATDEDSVKGQFGWVQLGKSYIPYIFRSGEKYCAVRMVELKLLSKYLNYLHQDIFSCTCIRSYYITDAESRLLNEINIKHSDYQFGRDMFTLRDLIVRLNDAEEFYNFLDVCYAKLIQGSCNPKDRCGFIRINKESVVPYTVKNGNKYVPLFYFEGETENLKLKADQLEGWDLSYLKFCCKVQGIRNELFAHDSCSVIGLDAIKSYFPADTGFEDYWPSKVVDSQLLVNGKNTTQVGQWTRQPPTPPMLQKAPAKSQTPTATHSNSTTSIQQQAHHAASTLQTTSQAQPSQPVFGNFTALGMTGNQNKYPSTATLQQSQAPVRATYQVSSARTVQRHQYYPPPPPPLTQAPPPLVRSAVPPTTGASTNYPVPPLTPANPNVMMMHDINNGITPQMVSYSSGSSARTTNMGQRYPPPLIPVRSTANGRYHPYNNTPTATDNVVDLSAARVPRTQIRAEDASQMSTNQINGRAQVELGKKLTAIAETPTSGTHIPYKIQKALVEGKMIPCINMKPYVWTELLVTLPDIIQNFFSAVPMSSCRRVMDVLGIELFRGNRQQMQILHVSGKVPANNESVPLVQVHDVIKYMPQMKYMLSSLLNEPMAKRTS